MDKIKVSSKGQITLPYRLREELDIKYGDTLLVEVRGNELILEIPEYRDFDSFADSIKKHPTTISDELISDIKEEKFRKRYEKSLR